MDQTTLRATMKIFLQLERLASDCSSYTFPGRPTHTHFLSSIILHTTYFSEIKTNP